MKWIYSEKLFFYFIKSEPSLLTNLRTDLPALCKQCIPSAIYESLFN
jgi:hypothetical protein